MVPASPPSQMDQMLQSLISEITSVTNQIAAIELSIQAIEFHLMSGDVSSIAANAKLLAAVEKYRILYSYLDENRRKEVLGQKMVSLQSQKASLQCQKASLQQKDAAHIWPRTVTSRQRQMPFLYTHVTTKILFVVRVDDFLVKFQRSTRSGVN